MPETRSLSVPRPVPHPDPTRRLPTLHPRPSTRTLALARIAIFATILIWLAYAVFTVLSLMVEPWAGDFGFALSSLGYLAVVTLLAVPALLYLVVRLGALERFRNHVRVPRAALDRFYATRRPSVTVLISSSDQGMAAVRRSLWSAALQEYPDLRVVHLLDGPGGAGSDRDDLRGVAAEVASELVPLRSRFTEARERFSIEGVEAGSDTSAASVLADHYAWAAAWLHRKANSSAGRLPADRFFADEVLAGLGDELELTAVALFAAVNQGEAPDAQRMSELYDRLVWIFSAELETFERRAFASLPSGNGRAGNLNAYLGLMGGSYRLEDSPDGGILHPCAPADADTVVPDADFVITLDASSVVLRDYALRLVHHLELPSNARVAVVQTPSSSVARATTVLGRTIEAATDLQHLQLQGMTRFGATVLAGSAATFRTRALRDIVDVEISGGFELRRFFRGTAAWHDSATSLEFERNGWSLVNYPERLSAIDTPPDFGSLVALPRRRAGSGMIVLPRILGSAGDRRARGDRVTGSELLVRVNAVTSPAVVSIALLFVLAFPHDGALPGIVFFLLALPYFLSRGADLRRCGHRYSTALWVYALQLVLLPMNLAGAFRSVRQAITNTRSSAPVATSAQGRTVTPIAYVLVPVALLVLLSARLLVDVTRGHWGDAAFGAFHVVLLLVAGIAFLGVRNSIVDIGVGLRRRSRAGNVVAEAPAGPLDWRAVLYHGHVEGVVPRSQLRARAHRSGGRHRVERTLGSDAGERRTEDQPRG
ncbi:glycosyltransferase family 2 protein [Planctomonas psychrotolerans]|uniref:glycosyltransferase family 2 protein n=1 Tax=Planctomonas psychrotolerans TaxID=2528712 RepID=UPI00123AF18E|nr:glycosyltransferase family 2 protein [Planctomonas psychrotolerans]